jgi:hypothetical protein
MAEKPPLDGSLPAVTPLSGMASEVPTFQLLRIPHQQSLVLLEFTSSCEHRTWLDLAPK